MKQAWTGVRQAGRASRSLAPDSLIFGHTEQMQHVREALDRFAEVPVPVLIEGESGTGKEVIARLFHQRFLRGRGPFVKVSCPALSATVSQHDASVAFTVASAPTPERGKAAKRGTLFL